MALDRLWTKEQITARLAEAGAVLRRLSLWSDEAKNFRRANRSCMPSPVRTILESYNFEPTRPGLGPPNSAEITRMDEAWTWLTHCRPDEIRTIVLAHACGANFSQIARRMPGGLGRMTIRRRWEVGIEQIFVGVNGEVDELWRYRRDALASAQAAMIAHERDWSLEERDAWLYGLIVAWHPEELPAVARRHRWDDAMVGRLKNLCRLLVDSIASPPGADPQPA